VHQQQRGPEVAHVLGHSVGEKLHQVTGKPALSKARPIFCAPRIGVDDEDPRGLAHAFERQLATPPPGVTRLTGQPPRELIAATD